MLWRLRTTLPDRPGSLAALARQCGEAGVNIVGLQVFPGADEVTDEVVLSCPDDWDLGRVSELLQGAPAANASWASGAPRRPWSTSRPATSMLPARSWPSPRRSPTSWPTSSTPTCSPVRTSRT